MVLTSELVHVTSAVLCVCVLFSHKIKFNLKELHKAFFLFFYWSAIESGPTFVALPTTGEICFGGVTLDDRWVEGPRVLKNLLVIRRNGMQRTHYGWQN